MAKEGSTISGFADAFAQAISYALQYGVPLQALVDKFSHVRFEPSGMTKNPDVRFAKSIVDYIFRWMATKFLSPEAQFRAGVNDRDEADASRRRRSTCRRRKSAAPAAPPPSAALRPSSRAARRSPRCRTRRTRRRARPAVRSWCAAARATSAATAARPAAARSRRHRPPPLSRFGAARWQARPVQHMKKGRGFTPALLRFERSHRDHRDHQIDQKINLQIAEIISSDHQLTTSQDQQIHVFCARPPSLPARTLLGLHAVPPAPARGHGRDPPRARLAARAADRRRQVAVLPGAGAGRATGWRVVVSPLISLMKDQVDTLVANGVPAACYNSALPPRHEAAVTRGLRDGRYRLLYVAPERLVGDGGDWLLRCWRPGRSASSPSTRPTASASGGTTSARSIASSAQLRDALPAGQPARLHRDGDRRACAGHRRAAWAARRGRTSRIVRSAEPRLPRAAARPALKTQMLEVLGAHRGEAGIIYCPSRKEVDDLSAWLQDDGCARAAVSRRAGRRRAAPQPGCLPRTKWSTSSSRRWRSGWASIDRTCASWFTPARRSRSSTTSRSPGRAGRDGLEAECVLIASGADFLNGA